MQRHREIIRLPEVCNRTGLARSTVYKLVRQGVFPRPVKLTPKASGWYADEIDGWSESLAAQRAD